MYCDPSVKANSFSFSPLTGHLAPDAVREITVTFCADEAVKFEDAKLFAELTQIEYVGEEPAEPVEGQDQHAPVEGNSSGSELLGIWDNFKQVIRPRTENDKQKIEAYQAAVKEYE